METLQDLVRGLEARGEALALVAVRAEATERASYARLASLARHLAAGLVGLGLEPEEAVAIVAGNRPEWVIGCLAIVHAGGVVVPLDAAASDEDLSHFVRDSGCRRALTAEPATARLERLAPGLKLVLLDAGAGDERSWRRLPGDRAPDRVARARPDDRAALFYTSGTTGRPKGVPLTHANCVSNLQALVDLRLVDASDRVLVPLPLHHVYPFMVGLLAPLACGAAVVLPADRTGPSLVQAMREGGVTAVVGVPRLYEALVEGLERHARQRGRAARLLFLAALGLSTFLRRRLGLRAGSALLAPVRSRLAPSVAKVASGGAALDPALAWRLEGLGWRVYTGYGLTETSPILTFNVPGASRLDSAGRPVPGVELRIADPDASGEGEVLARGPNVFAGYHRRPGATAEAFVPGGWFRTGDRGRIDAVGYLHLTGRVSERLVLADGKNVAPDEVEEIYRQNPVIREIGVLEREGRLVGVIVPDLQEVRRRAAGDVGGAVREAVAHRSRSLPGHQRLFQYVIVRESLPRTRLDKLRRHLLPEIFERARQGADAPRPARRRAPSVAELSQEDRALLEHPLARRVWEFLQARFPDQAVSPDSSPELDLGIDSLAWMDLTLELGRAAGVYLDERAIGRIGTVRDLLQESVGASGGAGAPVASPLERPEAALGEEQARWLEPAGPLISRLGAALLALNRGLVRRVLRLRVLGVERLPAPGPFVLAPNHVSYLDPLVLAAALPPAHLRDTYWGGATARMFRNPVMRLVSRAARVVPVDPERAAVSSLALGAAVIQRGKNLVWFPEGRRSPTGTLQAFMPGIGVLLERFGVPAVPVHIDGTGRALPPGRVLPRPTTVTVEFGTPRDPRALGRDGEDGTRHQRIARELQRAVAELASARGNR
jgi:long-chain acyl-CoA synthetase